MGTLNYGIQETQVQDPVWPSRFVGELWEIEVHETPPAREGGMERTEMESQLGAHHAE